MKWFLKRLLLLLAVFAASLTVFSLIINRKHDFTDTKGQQAASLPVLYMLNGETEFNPMYGYTRMPLADTFRETLTLLTPERDLRIRLYNCGMNVKGITYTVTSLSDGSVLEEGRVKRLAGDGTVTEGDIHLEQPVAMAREYGLSFAVDVGRDSPVYYQTRVVSRSGQNLSWYLDYAMQFCGCCVDKALTEQMEGQLEPNAAGLTASFHKLDIHSPEEMLTWGSLTTSFAVTPKPKLLEINETTVSIGLEYILRAASEGSGEEYWYVTEFYRMRKAQDQVILLDFERTTDSFFDGALPVLSGDGLNLGVAGRETVYRSNEAGDITAFVRNRELWIYDRKANKVTCAFSFRADRTAYDLRETRQTLDILVSNVYDNGNADFIVYGYMPTGVHEGQPGLSVYRYDAMDNTTTERVFIPLSDSFAFQEKNVARLAHVNTAGQLFLCLGDSIYRVDMATQAVDVLEDRVDWDSFRVSDSGMIMSWMDDASHIRLLNLENGATSEISAPQDMNIRNLGFSGEDALFGLAYFSNSYTDAAGNPVFLMSKVCIADFDGNVKMEYYRNGIYVTDIDRNEDVLLLKRAVKSETGVERAEDDQVVYYAPKTVNNVSLSFTQTEEKGTQALLTFNTAGKTSNLLALYSRYAAAESVPEAVIDADRLSGDYYYVYAKGGLLLVTARLNEAIASADENVGVVLDGRQQYVWERGNVKTAVKLDFSSVPEALVTAQTTEASVAAAIGDGYNVRNLSGCSLSSIRYQLSSGYAVVGRWNAGEDILIMGYDQYNIWFCDPWSGELKAVAIEDAEEHFTRMNNVFISYHEK